MSPTAPPVELAIDPATRTALARAAELRLIGLLFERPSPARTHDALALARELDDAVLASAAHLLTAIDDLDYDTLFGPGGPSSPREAAYIERRDPAAAMAEASAYYDAFGFRPVAGEPVDHVASEAGFTGYLWLKEAYARERGDTEAADVTRLARERFTAEHLAVLAGGLAARLDDCPDEPWRRLAEVLLARAGGRRLTQEQLEAGDTEGELTCGACAE